MTKNKLLLKNEKGVSLLELSIVIAIIGLLLAATMQGFSMRKSSELRSFMNDINTYQSAIEGFYSKYSALPGDMSDAFSYWDDGSGGICGNITQCNGDNNGRIAVDSGLLDSESYRAWQHLVLSEFLGGGYTGTATSTIQADIGVNIPAAKRTKVGYSIFYDNDATSSAFDHETTTGEGSRNEINLGTFYPSNVNTNGAVTPDEGLAIDLKLDDGKPSTGRVHGIDGSDATANTCVSAGAAYVTGTEKTTCRLTFPAKL